MYDDKHQFWLISSDDDGEFNKLRKGLREYLLCQACETRFSKLESYASNAIFGNQKLIVEEHPATPSHLKFHGVEYGKFKLFLLSLLWRMSITTLPFFDQVRLGEKHEEILRKMLLNENPGEPQDYGCIISAMLHNDKHFDSFAVAPERHRIESLNGYRFAIRGLAFWFIVSKEAHLFSRTELFLTRSGILPFHIGEAKRMGFVADSVVNAKPALSANRQRILSGGRK